MSSNGQDAPSGGRSVSDADRSDGNIHQSAAAVQARRSSVGPARAVGMPVE